MILRSVPPLRVPTHPGIRPSQQRNSQPTVAGNRPRGTIGRRFHSRAALQQIAWLLLVLVPLPTAWAQDSSKPPSFGQAAGRLGGGRYAPGEWGVVGFEIVNPGTEPVEMVAGMFFKSQPNLQFGRRVWVPADSRRRSWYPVWVPEDLEVEKSTLEAVTFLINDTDGQNERLRSRDGEFIASTLLPLKKLPISLLIGKVSPGAEAYEALIAVRVMRGMDRVTQELVGGQLPPTPEGLASVDHILLADDTIRTDTSTVETIRRWLLAGGHMWIMLDQIDPATVQAVLGDAFDTTVIDRVQLHTTQIKETRDLPNMEGDPEPNEFEQPVTLVRTIPGSVDVVYQQDEWPAAFWQKYGKGRVLFTTLSAPAWVRPRIPTDPTPFDPGHNTKMFPREPLQALGVEFMELHHKPLDTTELFEPYLNEHIGYSITERWIVITMLFGFAGLILVIGWVLQRKQSLGQLAWITPLLAIVVAGGFAGMGAAKQRAVPATLAVAGFAELASGSPDIQYDGVIATYHQSGTSEIIGLDGGGIYLPDRQGMEGEVVRLLWRDVDRADWDPLQIPLGVRTAEFSRAEQMSVPTSARAQLGPNGVEGRFVSGDLENVGDLLIVTPTRGLLHVSLDDEGRFQSGSDQIVSGDSYVSGVVLTDEQRRRQAVFARLFSSPELIVNEPTLVGWSDPRKSGFRFPETTRETGGLLFRMPLNLDPTPPGSQVLIPAPFLSYRLAMSPDGEISSSIYDRNNRQWLESKRSAQMYLHFALPPQTLPLKVQSARLTLRIDASERPVEFIGFDNQQRVTMGSLDGPVGRYETQLEPADILKVNADGKIIIGILVGNHAEQAAGNETNWKMESVELELTGIREGPPDF